MMLRQLSFLINLLCIVLVSVWLLSPAHADRLKDMASIEGVRSNQLIGYGLVVGLDGTGDKTPFTSQTFRNLMNQFGIWMIEREQEELRNLKHNILSDVRKIGEEE